MRKIIEIRAGRNINLSDYGLLASTIKRIWTVYDEEEMWNYSSSNFDKGIRVNRTNLETLKPFHNHGVFFEDKVHDWDVNIKENLLHYGSRVVKQGSVVKILVEYEE